MPRKKAKDQEQLLSHPIIIRVTKTVFDRLENKRKESDCGTIGAQGERMDLHDIGRKLSEPARKELEIEFGLVKAEESNQEKQQAAIKPADLEKARYGRLPTKRAISNVVTAVSRDYKFTSLVEYNAVSERRESSRAAGSMSTTAADYARFFINLMSGRGLQKSNIRQMLSPQIPVNSKRGFGPLKDSLTHENDAIKLSWGLGIGLFQSPYGKAFFHTGHGDTNQNYAVAFPEQGIAVVLLSNSENFEAVSAEIGQACIGDVYSPFKWLGHLDR